MRQKKIPSIVFFLKGTSEFVLVFTYPFVEIQYLSSHTGIQQAVLKYLLRRPLAKNSTNCKINIGKHVQKMLKGYNTTYATLLKIQ